MTRLSRWVVAALLGGVAIPAIPVTSVMAAQEDSSSSADKDKDKDQDREKIKGVPEMSPATAGSVAVILVGGAALLSTRRRPRNGDNPV